MQQRITHFKSVGHETCAGNEKMLKRQDDEIRNFDNGTIIIVLLYTQLYIIMIFFQQHYKSMNYLFINFETYIIPTIHLP